MNRAYTSGPHNHRRNILTDRMRMRDETYRTLYAISKLKAPLASSVQRLLGDKDRHTTSQKLDGLAEHGLVEKRPYGKQRVLYMLSLAGRSVLDKRLETGAAPQLVEHTAPKQQREKKGYVPKERAPDIVPPRQISVMVGYYTTPKDGYIREDGNKKIKSLGAFSA